MSMIDRPMLDLLTSHFGHEAVVAAQERGLLDELRFTLRRQGWALQPVHLGSSQQVGLIVLGAGGEVRIPVSMRRDVARHGVHLTAEPDGSDTIVVSAQIADDAVSRLTVASSG